ncbi:MAG: pilus assembly protein [Elusimicrobiaceae bacterium]|nr:pilus assembly protein [Elusimicrobiaceae bacterium]
MKFFHRERGQVTVELLLILPVFLLMIFFVLEYGNIAYRTLVLNHASYEFARIAALVGVDKPSGIASRTVMQQKIDQAKRKVFGQEAERLNVQVKVETTGVDPMYKKHRHQDVVVTVVYPVKLSFPGTSYILADEPRREGVRKLRATARMPVEKAYLSSDQR